LLSSPLIFVFCITKSSVSLAQTTATGTLIPTFTLLAPQTIGKISHLTLTFTKFNLSPSG
jgi:hypothetical protein